MNNDVKLTGLEVNNYTLVGNAEFHKALTHQTSLESVKLKADPEDCTREDIETLITSIGALTNLKYLNLEATSDPFLMSDITQMISTLRKLEEFEFGKVILLSLNPNAFYCRGTNICPGGDEVNDEIWASLSNLTNLKSLNIHAHSKFSAEGIVEYIFTLQNRGFQLQILNQNFRYNLSEDELALVRQSIIAQVDGQLYYVLYRDQESEDESFSD